MHQITVITAIIDNLVKYKKVIHDKPENGNMDTNTLGDINKQHCFY